MTVTAFNPIQTKINALKSQLDQPRPDLVNKYKYLVPALFDNEDATLQQVYDAVKVHMNLLNQEERPITGRTASDREILGIGRNFYAISCINGKNNETNLLDTVEKINSSIAEYKKMQPIFTPLSDAISCFSLDLISIVASYAIESTDPV